MDVAPIPAPDDEPSAGRAPAGSGAPARRPALRASDADREGVAQLLRVAGGDGRLALHELDERLDAAYRAVTRADLEPLVADLGHGAGHVVGAPDPAGGRHVAVRDADDGTAWLVAVMGGTERRGRWRLGRRCRAISVMGGTTLDLSEVEFDAHDVHLDVFDVMGGSEIVVPEHMNVRLSKFAFMGGHGVKLGAEEPDPGGPVLHLRLVAVMGGSTIRRRGVAPRRRR
jgi:hypothetical protein